MPSALDAILKSTLLVTDRRNYHESNLVLNLKNSSSFP